MYTLSANTTIPSILPDTSGAVLTVAAVIALAIGVAVIATATVRQLAKKHYKA